MTKADIVNTFLSVFPYLSDEEIQALLSISEYVSTPKKKMVIEAQNVDHSIFFLLKGMIRGFFINENGEEKNIFLRPEKTITGAPESLFYDRPTKFSFEAMPRSKYLVFTKEGLDSLIEKYPNFRKMWVETLQENIFTLIGRVESLIDRNPEKRYEELLQSSPNFFQTAYNKHIANYLGMTSVSLSRIIKRKSSKKN